MTSSEDEADQWLLENLEDWYDAENDPEIEYIISQALEQEFTFMTINAINIYEDSSVDWDQSDNRDWMLNIRLVPSESYITDVLEKGIL